MFMVLLTDLATILVIVIEEQGITMILKISLNLLKADSEPYILETLKGMCWFLMD